MDAGFKEDRLPHPKASTNIFGSLTFWWILDLFKKGRKKDLETNDLYATLDEHSSSLLGSVLDEKWRTELTNATKANRRPSLLRALIRMYGPTFLLYGLLIAIVELVLRIYQSILIGKIVEVFEQDATTSAKYVNLKIMYGVGLMISSLLYSVGFSVYDIMTKHMGMKIRVSICNLVYNKALRLSKTALDETTTGQIVNLLSGDVNRFDMGLFFLHFLWIGPLQATVVIYFLWQEVGVSALIGIIVLITFIPLQGWLGKKISKLRLKTAVATDERLRLVNEIISGIQVIKMYSWEKPFERLVEHARRNEMQHIRGYSFIRAVIMSFYQFQNRISLFFCIFTYVLLGNFITSKKDFLLSEEKDKQTGDIWTADADVTDDARSNFNDENVALRKIDDAAQPNDSVIKLTNVSVKWKSAQTNNTLNRINMTVKSGQLVAIVGPVGAGKSSLIQTVLRELPLTQGTISVRGIVSYASQEPWIFASSVRQNILFGLPMDEQRYAKVIDVCELQADIARFPFGDRTIVGERGVSLSGGQRARINLARAMYKQADIYLLDDPLSAVDTRVGKNIFEKCIQEYLKEKTRILVTHQLQHLKNVDRIVLMANVLAEGSYRELKVSGLDVSKLLGCSEDSVAAAAEPGAENDGASDAARDERASEECFRPVADRGETEPEGTNETRRFGKTPSSVYASYFSAGGSAASVFLFFSVCIFTQILTCGADYWIAFWVDLEERHSATSTDAISALPPSRETCVTVFAALIFSVILATFARSVAFVSVCTNASVNLHNGMFDAVIGATTYFFNTNSSGRILNRFSQDIGVLDETLMSIFIDCIQVGLSSVGIIVIVGIVNAYIVIPIFFVGIIVHRLRAFYLSTSQSIKRLEGITRSPVIAHVNASLQGLTTIRAFGAEKVVSEEFGVHQDLHSTAWYLFISSGRAFGLWLDVICYVYIISTVTFSFSLVDASAGNVGLCITQAMALGGSFQWTIRQFAELQNQMIAVERVLEYKNAPREAAAGTALDGKPPKNWPRKGRIVFSDFFLRYSPDAPYALRNLNVRVEPNEKIGIVGRTGAGKSSLIGALFRLAFNEGSILIDDVEIHGLALDELRSKLSIIPQEPFLFSGTLRKNLDPFDEYSDHMLWNALHRVELRDVIENLPGTLNATITNGGSEFSVGQRQLVCMARAIVRNNKILILDEATANVDQQTDALIQNAIRNTFKTCTVLTIAHRLNTVVDSDKVLVMNAGEVVEFDHSYNLLQNKNGFFYKMVEHTGKDNAETLHRMAAESYSATQLTKSVQ